MLSISEAQVRTSVKTYDLERRITSLERTVLANTNQISVLETDRQRLQLCLQESYYALQKALNLGYGV